MGLDGYERPGSDHGIKDFARFGYGSIAFILTWSVFMGAGIGITFLAGWQNAPAWLAIVFWLLVLIGFFVAARMGGAVMNSRRELVTGPGVVVGVISALVICCAALAAIALVLFIYAAVIAIAFMLGILGIIAIQSR